MAVCDDCRIQFTKDEGYVTGPVVSAGHRYTNGGPYSLCSELEIDGLEDVISVCVMYWRAANTIVRLVSFRF